MLYEANVDIKEYLWILFSYMIDNIELWLGKHSLILAFLFSVQQFIFAECLGSETWPLINQEKINVKWIEAIKSNIRTR